MKVYQVHACCEACAIKKGLPTVQVLQAAGFGDALLGLTHFRLEACEVGRTSRAIPSNRICKPAGSVRQQSPFRQVSAYALITLFRNILHFGSCQLALASIPLNLPAEQSP